ncbi:polyketide synthase dehydratase domain-containing protein [Streptomyces sp. KLMMK]|uniref:polyketide synthase dehydratase domain-containing protein n=1 Tax=Streptomyces sp. KLMMK TaxID=3109353 RepID=UPI003009517E
MFHLAQVHCSGYDSIDFAAHHKDEQLTDVPGTSWHRTRHGGDQTPYTLVAPHLVGATQHPLLGGQVHDPEHPARHLWQTPSSPRRLPWLGDHQVAGVPVLPGTGFAEMLLAAGAQDFASGQVALTGLSIGSPLILDPEPLVTTRLVHDGDGARAEVLTHTDDGNLVHAHAPVHPLAVPLPPRIAPSSLATPEWSDSEPAYLYWHFRARHNIFHGPAFTAIDRIQVHPNRNRVVASLRIDVRARVSAWTMALHPALADEVVQTVVAAWLGYCATSPGPVVVAGCDEIRVYGPTAHARLASNELHQADDLACTASGQRATAEGMVVAELRGLNLTNITPPEQRYVDRLAHLAWVPGPQPPLQQSSNQQWLVVAPEETHWGRRLSVMLGKHSAGSLLTHPARTDSGHPPARRGPGRRGGTAPHPPPAHLQRGRRHRRPPAGCPGHRAQHLDGASAPGRHRGTRTAQVRCLRVPRTLTQQHGTLRRHPAGGGPGRPAHRRPADHRDRLEERGTQHRPRPPGTPAPPPAQPACRPWSGAMGPTWSPAAWAAWAW